MAENPFDKFKTGFSLKLPTTNPQNGHGGNQDVFNSARVIEAKKAAQATHPKEAVEVNFPNHLYIPKGAQSLDLRKVMNIPAGTRDYELFKYKAPPGAVTRFISYGVYNDGDNGNDYNFKPQLDGNRIFPYHGDPTTFDFKIYLGLGPDLSQVAMIPCQLYVQPGQTVRWLLTNTSTVDTSMGVRMCGYFDSSQLLETGRYGG